MVAALDTALVKTLTRHGNSFALVIDKPILEMLGIGPDTPLQISTDGHQLIIVPKREPLSEEAFKATLRGVNDEFGDVLKNLAKYRQNSLRVARAA